MVGLRHTVLAAFAPNVVCIGDVLQIASVPSHSVAERMDKAAVSIAEYVPCVCHILVASLTPAAVEVAVHAVDKLAVVYPYMRAAIV